MRIHSIEHNMANMPKTPQTTVLQTPTTHNRGARISQMGPFSIDYAQMTDPLISAYNSQRPSFALNQNNNNNNIIIISTNKN